MHIIGYKFKSCLEDFRVLNYHKDKDNLEELMLGLVSFKLAVIF